MTITILISNPLVEEEVPVLAVITWVSVLIVVVATSINSLEDFFSLPKKHIRHNNGLHDDVG